MAAHSNHIQTIEQAAQTYLGRGYSPIPLRGKRPAVAWKTYQRRRATPAEWVSWLAGGGISGVGLVTGVVSRLAVLDFDQAAVLVAFKQTHPDLAATHTVGTKRGVHLYFHLPPHLSTASYKGRGVDWLWAGCYVVAPPSQVEAHTYGVLQGGQPRTLTAHDLARIRRFLGRFSAHRSSSAQASKNPQNRPFRSLAEGLQEPVTVSTTSLTNRYRRQATPGQRNQALFAISCAARDQGWSLTSVVDTLAEVHTQQQ